MAWLRVYQDTLIELLKSKAKHLAYQEVTYCITS
ncbi:hypothetical protein PQC43_gp115 [Escherichia phage vB_EcoP-101114UKE3]|uniref:Uncharacterized protein n=1 Tax=Escherichia phage vB_EcoP-101114UKE3 TaxID=2865794 RepID=A0AAE7XSY8_9CAUD|nr:hypothetical protein PQC43_gp115 [Escherichia phage vB_EcoP-101114UKE3]QZI79269.1 hypothetical protein 101114UKE3_138 [Escherichia phage vB_EcoP-101114UKE3]USM81242.1 hypothetical protein 101114BS3_115 [Escherichia phage vB_EcoP-101114BS3]